MEGASKKKALVNVFGSEIKLIKLFLDTLSLRGFFGLFSGSPMFSEIPRFYSFFLGRFGVSAKEQERKRNRV